MIKILTELSVILMSFAMLNFVVSIFFKRNDVADIGWGLGFVIVCIYMLFNTTATPSTITLCIVTNIWGLRLSLYIGIRNSKKSEDFRYKKWRDEWGSSFYWRSLMQVFVLQMLILLIISLPIIISGCYSRPESLNTIQYIALLLWTVGFLWEAIADYQLSQFKKKKSGSIMTTGLWKYSRHPNYFGEIVMWLSAFLFVINIEYGYYAILSPIMITFLLFKVSGVPLLEDKYKNNSEYKDYVDKTPSIIPFMK